jgi:hypothetical protein
LPFAGKLLAAPLAGDDPLPFSGKALLPLSESSGAGRARSACWAASVPSPGKLVSAFGFFPLGSSALAGLSMASNNTVFFEPRNSGGGKCGVTLGPLGFNDLWKWKVFFEQNTLFQKKYNIFKSCRSNFGGKVAQGNF